jgi:hypothetical protein
MTANKVHKITIITSSHLVNNPRVWKEANALSTAGYDVTIFTTWHSKKLRSKDQNLINDFVNYNSLCNLIKSESSKMQIIYQKVIRKLANYIFYLFNSGSIYQFTARPKWQIKKITESKSDLYICHQETGLLLGVELLKMGYKVAIDFEDWYSEDYLNKFRPVNLLKNAEAFVLKNTEYVSCPSESMATAINNAYGIKKYIHVIYNSFPSINTYQKQVERIPNSMVWFSQTIGPNRGIEFLLKALKLIKVPLQIHFIGKCSKYYKSHIVEELHGTNHIYKIHPLMEHDELLNYLPRFQVGLALENHLPLSRELTITNKILLYLQFNLYVIATKTKGHLEVYQQCKDSISLVNSNDIMQFSNAITESMNFSFNKNFDIFPKKLSWEYQENRLVNIVSKNIF